MERKSFIKLAYAFTSGLLVMYWFLRPMNKPIQGVVEQIGQEEIYADQQSSYQDYYSNEQAQLEDLLISNILANHKQDGDVVVNVNGEFQLIDSLDRIYYMDYIEQKEVERREKIEFQKHITIDHTLDSLLITNNYKERI